MTLKDAMDHIPEGAKNAADIASAATVLGTLFNYLPGVAALLTIVWTTIRIIETDTARSIWKKIRKKP